VRRKIDKREAIQQWTGRIVQHNVRSRGSTIFCFQSENGLAWIVRGTSATRGLKQECEPGEERPRGPYGIENLLTFGLAFGDELRHFRVGTDRLDEDDLTGG
jgi:hypothetical protein